MMNKYIKIKMTPTKYGIGGSFIAEANFKLDNLDVPFYNIPIKIDTGCSMSTIPLKKLRVSENMCSKLKRDDIEKGIVSYLSYGVETGGEKHEVPITFNQKMECAALKFVHNISEFTISGVDIDSNSICLNYNRSGNILIGMDILKDWDVHIGSINKNETYFVACPKDKIGEEYNSEIYHLFGIKRS